MDSLKIAPAGIRAARSICAFTLLLGLHAATVVAGPSVEAADPASPDRDEDALKAVHTPFAETEVEMPDAEVDMGEQSEDRCDRHPTSDDIQEESQEILRSWSCHSFRWFDGLWGNSKDFDEDAVNGLLTFGAEYTEYEGFDPKFRLRVRAPLPNLSSRWDLLLGRVDEEAFVTDTQGQDKTFYNPGVIDRGREEEWLLGLGHRGKAQKRGWDYSAGVRLRLPPRPYVKAQWYYNHDFSEGSDFRFRQTFFWRADQGFGTTSRGDMAYSIDPQNVLRWEGIGTIHEETHGVQWYFGQTWYHLFANRSAISLRTFAEGQTGWEVRMREFGFHLVWRRPFTRDWIYLSMGPEITWPRDFADQERELSLGFGLWLEVEFGQWRW